MNIGLDMMGGDFAPLEAIKGIALYLSEAGGNTCTLTLIGKENIIKELLSNNHISSDTINVVHAEQEIEMH